MDFWRRCRGGVRQVKSRHTKYPSQTLIPHITLFAICLSFSSPPLHPCRFIRPLFRSLVVMASPLSTPLSLEFEVLHFKQKQGENLKDAWYRLIESYRGCTIEGDFKVLLRNFYVGLTSSHRQLLDFAAKGYFIDIDPSVAYEIIEGIVGILPPQNGPSSKGTQILEKLCELQKSIEPLKNVGGNLHRMNTLITLCNKRLDALDLKVSEYEGKRKEPPGSEHNSIKKINTKDGNT